MRLRAAASLLSIAIVALGGADRAQACSCAWEGPNTNMGPVYKWALENASLMLQGRVEALRPGRNKYERVATVRVLEAWKGVKTGAQITVRFGDDTSCSSGIPKLNSIGDWALVGTVRDSSPAACLPFPYGPDGARLLADYRQTWQRLEEEAEREPRSLDAQLALADYLSTWGDKAGALAVFERAARIAPNDTRVQTGLGLTLMRLERFRQADRAFAKALAADPRNGRAYLGRVEAASRAAKARQALHSIYQRHPLVHDASHVDLGGQDLSRLSLSYIDFKDLHADRSDWAEARLDHVGLEGAALGGADLSGARIVDSRLSGANLDGARAPRTSFEGSVLTGLHARGLDAPGTRFIRGKLAGADLGAANLVGAEFIRADLSRVSFEKAKLDGAKFQWADLRGADLRRASVDGAIFTFAKMDCLTIFPEGFDPRSHRVIPTQSCGGLYSLDFSGQNLGGANFSDLDLREAGFRSAKLLSASFSHANVDGVDFSGAELRTDFRGASARGAKFLDVIGKPYFADTDLSGAVLSGRNPPDQGTKSTLNASAGDLPQVLTSANGSVAAMDPNGPLVLHFDVGVPRMTGAHVTRANLDLNPFVDSSGFSASAANLGTLLEARFENSVMNCLKWAPNRLDRGGTRTAWGNFIALLAAARELRARNPSLAVTEACEGAIDRYLGQGCEAGRKEAGFAYFCPMPSG